MREESIQFACERLARGGLKQQECCGVAIMFAFEVDPMLAAEMIFRSTNAIWMRVGSAIQGLIEQWHTPGQIDRTLRFMMSSGRPEFFDQVWPLITHENDQVHLGALRAGRRFRPSLLGSDAAKRIAALPANIRKHVLCEIAFNSGMDGLDLAAAVAKDDLDHEVKVEVIGALAFRRADRQVADVLCDADEKTFDLVVRRGNVDEATDEHVKKGMEAARARQRKEGGSAHDRLRTIMYTHKEDLSGEVAGIIAGIEIKDGRDAAVELIYRVRDRYSRAIADGLLQRIRAGHRLFYGADNLLASAGFSLEDDELLNIALSEAARHDDRAEAAASVLGPQAGRMIDTVFEAKKYLRDANGKYNRRRTAIRSARPHQDAPGTSLSLLFGRARTGRNEEMADLADLISPSRWRGDRGRPFDSDARVMIQALAEVGATDAGLGQGRGRN